MSLSGSGRIGIWLGDSFAEVAEISAQVSSPHRDTAERTPASVILKTLRWFHPKKSVSETLREILTSRVAGGDTEGGEIRIATSRAEMSVARKQGTEPAVLVTAGFETWAKLGSKVLTTAPALRSERAWFPSTREKIFGVEERVHADGSVARELKSEELEFLIAKLELLKIKEIAIAFLHADRFPGHEKIAAEFFRSRGYHVTTSHELPSASRFSDVERARRTVENAFADTVVRDDLESLRTVLRDLALEEKWQIRFQTTSGLKDESSASSVRGGVEFALAAAIPSDVELGYFFGLEEFLGFRKLADGSRETYLLPVQPTAQIGVSSWPFPSWTSIDRGYEPGPMLFGRSHQLTLLDVLFVRDRFSREIDGFSERVQAKSSARILEALSTLGKNLAEPGRRAVDAKDVAQDLETGLVERLSMDLSFSAGASKSVYLAGPLASVLMTLLAHRRSDLDFKIDAELSVASAALGGN